MHFHLHLSDPTLRFNAHSPHLSLASHPGRQILIEIPLPELQAALLAYLRFLLEDKATIDSLALSLAATSQNSLHAAVHANLSKGILSTTLHLSAQLTLLPDLALQLTQLTC